MNAACSLSVALSVLLTLGGLLPRAAAQGVSRAAQADSPLVVEGTVRQEYRSTGPGSRRTLIEIEVARSDGRKALPGGSTARFPAPGERAYIYLPDAEAAQGRLPPDAEIRAYLQVEDGGGWQMVAWEPLAERGGGIELPPGEPRDRGLRSQLGMTAKALEVQGKFALRVASVERGGLAQEAGLEVGDVIAGVNGKPLRSAAELESLAELGNPFTMTVVDVNTGRSVEVQVAPATVAEAEDERAEAPAEAPKASLGISAEPVIVDGRGALKVTRVDPAGPAARAGLETGDVILAANGAPMTGPEQLLSALRKSGPTLELTVRDSRTGRKAEVQLQLGGSRTPPSVPAELDVPATTPPGALGAVTELAFNDDDFAVKVTEVTPGGAAARAGLKPGILILAANGKPMLHPNDLADELRESGATVRLSTLDPSTGRRAELNVELR